MLFCATCWAVAPTVVAVNPISVALELFVGTTAGLIVKLSPTGTVLLSLHAPDDAAVCSLCTHPTLPLLFAAHVNGYIRVFDIATGACCRVSWDG